MRAKRLSTAVVILFGLAIMGITAHAAGENAILEGHTDVVRAVSFSPDGRLLASGSGDRTIKVWDVETRDLVTSIPGHTAIVRSVQFSPDGEVIASASTDGTVKLWNVATGEQLLELLHPDEVNSVVFSPDGQTLVTGCDDAVVRVWELASGEETAALLGHTNWIWCVAISSDGERIASASEDGTSRVWNAQTGEAVHVMRHSVLGRAVPANTISFLPDGDLVAIGTDENLVELWDVSTGESIAELTGHEGRVWSTAFSPNGEWIASSSEDGSIMLWVTESKRRAHRLTEHTGTVFAVTFSPDGALLASGSADGTVRLWPVPPLPSTSIAILLYSKACDGSREFFPDALDNLGQPYSRVDSHAALREALTEGGPWTLVIVDEYQSTLNEETLSIIQNYISEGGRLYMNYWKWDNIPSIATTLGADLGPKYTSPIEIFLWEDDHPLFTVPNRLTALRPTEDTCGTDGARFSADADSAAIAGYVTDPETSECAIIIGNDGRTILFGGILGLFAGDDNESGRPDGLEFAENVISFLLGACTVVVEEPRYPPVTCPTVWATVTVEGIEGLLERMDIEFTRDSIQSGVLWILTMPRGQTVVLVPGGPTPTVPPAYSNLSLIAVWVVEEKPSLARINEWNTTYRGSRAYLDKDGDPWLQYDLYLHAGVSPDSIEVWIRDFQIMLEAFADWIGF